MMVCFLLLRVRAVRQVRPQLVNLRARASGLAANGLY